MDNPLVENTLGKKKCFLCQIRLAFNGHKFLCVRVNDLRNVLIDTVESESTSRRFMAANMD